MDGKSLHFGEQRYRIVPTLEVRLPGLGPRSVGSGLVRRAL